MKTALNLILILFSVSCYVDCVSLDAEGYYDIVIAINEKTAQDTNPEYLNNLKAGIQDMSHAIFETTNRSFSIRSVDIILPNHWTTPADAFATTQHYQNADIRISHEYLVPQTINPTFCGYPGRYIELPYKFFDTYDNGPYGLTGKSLLTLWARYRFGIFEEHGYPGDPKFPYFWKSWAPWKFDEEEDPEKETWNVTNCHDAEIKGHYVTLPETCNPDENPTPPPEASTTEPPTDSTTDDPSTTTEDPSITTESSYDPDDPLKLYPPPSNVRFCPELINQTATSSVMSYIFMKSLLHFCDETTHNKLAPNRQNLFCQFKSAWEVIRQSKDWKKLNNRAINDRKPINFRILKKTEKPLLFILTEGLNPLPENVTSIMASKLNILFENPQHWNVLTSLGVFPGKNFKDSYDTIYNWNTPWNNPQELSSLFQESSGSRQPPLFRDFAAALQNVATQIKLMDHSPGAIIIMLKFGTESDPILQIQSPAYDAPVLASIISQNIRLFILEGEDPLSNYDPSLPYRLKNIAELSGGLHLKIGNDYEEDLENIDKVISEVDTILTTGQVPYTRYRLAFTDSRHFEMDNDIAEIPFLVNYQNVSSLQFYFYSGIETYSYDELNLQIIKAPDGVTNIPTFEEYFPWGNTLVGSFHTLLANWTAPPDVGPLTDPSEWTLSFSSYCYDCYATIVVIAELDESQPPSPPPPVHPTSSDAIKIEVYTSMENDENVIPLDIETVASLKGVAFAIYAKLEKDGHPINSPDLEVTAHICHYLDGNILDYYSGYFPPVICRGVTLKDNGPWSGDPDLTANDGIFSGSYMPKSDIELDDHRGTHQIFVTAQLLPKSEVIKSGPLPVDQENIRCGSGYTGCWTETVTEPFFVQADLHKKIVFYGQEENEIAKAAATRVMDLRISRTPSQPFGFYDIEWTESGILGEANARKVDQYELHFSNSYEDIVNGTFRGQVTGMPRPMWPGRSIKVTVNDLAAGEKRWYMLKSLVDLPDTPEPVWSNLIFIYAKEEYFRTTTTTTTTTEPPPTPTTTRLPTTTGGTPTLPTQETTGPTVTTRRTTPPTTTRPSTTVTTTTKRPTTVKYEPKKEASNSWLKSTGGIVTLSVFGTGMVILGGVIIYLKKMTNRAV